MLTKFKKLFKDDLILHTAIVFAGTIFVGVSNLFYQLISVRLLTPQDYGTFNALISFVMFTSVTISPLCMTLTRFFTEYIAKRDFAKLLSVLKMLIKRLFIIACIITGLFFVISPFLAEFFKTQVFYIVICGAIIVIGLFSPPLISLFQSFQKFVAYSLIDIISSLGKLIFGAGLMFLGYKVLGGLSGYLAGTILMPLVALVFVFGIFNNKIGSVNFKTLPAVSLSPIYKYFFPVAITMLSFTLLTNIDVILVKHFFPPLDAGYYSIAQIAGKITLFLPSALAVVIFPKSTTHYVKGSNPNKLLYKSLALTAILCGVISIFCFLFPELILRVLTSKQNPVSNSLVGLFSLTMAFYALVWIIVNFMLATHNLRIVPFLLVIAVLESVSIYTWHSSLKMVLYFLLFFSIISFIVSIYVVKRGWRKGKLT